MSVTTPVEDIKSNFRQIKRIENELKQEIIQLLSDSVLKFEITQKIRDDLEKYTSQTWEYFGQTTYFDDNLSILYEAMNNYSFLLSRKYFLIKKTILIYQEELMKNKEHSMAL